jgi:hypothetical protein
MKNNRTVHARFGAPVPDQTVESPTATGADGDSKLEVFVLFTNPTATLTALSMADRLTRELGCRLRLLMPYEVPCTLPLTERAIPAGLLEDQLDALAPMSPADISAHVLLCRDKLRTLRLLLKPHSLLLIGGRKRWWPTKEERLARTLKKDGHEVIFAELR